MEVMYINNYCIEPRSYKHVLNIHIRHLQNIYVHGEEYTHVDVTLHFYKSRMESNPV